MIGIVKRKVFRISRLLKGTDCEAYVDRLVMHGFEDRGAFAAITDHVLATELNIYNRHHRHILLQLAAKVENSNEDYQKAKQAMDEKPKNLTVDGETFYERYLTFVVYDFPSLRC